MPPHAVVRRRIELRITANAEAQMKRQAERRTLNSLRRLANGRQSEIRAIPELLPFEVALKAELKRQDYRKGQKGQSQVRGR